MKNKNNDQLENLDLVSQAEAARRLGVAKNTLVKYRHLFNTYRLAGKLPTTGTLLFRVSELDKFANEYLIDRKIVVREVNPMKQIKSFVTSDSGIPDKLYSQREAGKYTGIHPDVISKWGREGELKTLKLNQLTLYRKSELDKIKKR